MIGWVMAAMSCAALCVGTVGAVGAGAAEPPEPPPGFELKGTNGYRIGVSPYVNPTTGREAVALAASRGRESVAYVAAAKVTEDSIHADLGSLGRIDLVLHKSGTTKTVNSRCFRKKETYEPATYEGILEFHGEGGFTRARTTRVAAVPPLALLASSRICSGESYGEASGPSEPGARLRGISYAGGRTLQFQFNKNWAGGKTLIGASLKERRDGIRIYREFTRTVAAGAFHYDPKLRAATLDPPSPFSGSAKVGRDRDSVSPLITGDLRVAFPGRTVQLTGPEVHVSLAHAKRTKGNGGSVSIGFRRGVTR